MVADRVRRVRLRSAALAAGVTLLFLFSSMGSMVLAQAPVPEPLDTVDDVVAPICVVLGLGTDNCVTSEVCAALGLPYTSCMCVDLGEAADLGRECHSDPAANPPPCTPGAGPVAHECVPTPHPVESPPERPEHCGATTMADRSAWLRPYTRLVTVEQSVVPIYSEQCCEGPYTRPPMLAYDLKSPVETQVRTEGRVNASAAVEHADNYGAYYAGYYGGYVGDSTGWAVGVVNSVSAAEIPVDPNNITIPDIPEPGEIPDIPDLPDIPDVPDIPDPPDPPEIRTELPEVGRIAADVLPGTNVRIKVNTPRVGTDPTVVFSYIEAGKYFLEPRQGPPRTGESCGDPNPYTFEPKRNAVELGGDVQQICGCGAGGAGVGAGGTVGVFNGEFKFPLQAAVMPASRGLDFEFNLTYRSRSPVATAGDGLLGPRWDYSYGSFLSMLPNGSVVRDDGGGRADLYVATDSETDASPALERRWITPRGFYDVLEQRSSTTLEIVDRYGRTETYTRKSDVWPNQPGPLNDQTYLLTGISDRNDNGLRIWPYHPLPGYGAAMDAHNRLFYWTRDGVFLYEGLELSDREAVIMDYEVEFNWTTAGWNVFDFSDHRLSAHPPNTDTSGFNDPSPRRRNFTWDYGRDAWDRTCSWNETTHSYDTKADECWHGKPVDDGDAHADPEWEDPPPTTDPEYDAWHATWHPWPEDYDNDTLDNEPNCTITPAWDCIPDLNTNWTLKLRTLSTFTYSGARLAQVESEGGESTRFEYQGGLMSRVKNGYGQEYMTNSYDGHGRLYMQQHGYGFWHFGFNTIDGFTRVTDRNGNVVDYHYVSPDKPLLWKKVEWTNRNMNAVDPDNFVTTYAYNRNMEVTRVRHPRGNLEYFIYDDTNLDRLSQGNLLCHIDDPGPFTTDIDGEAQYPQLTRWTYDNNINRPITMRDARSEYPGFVPPNGGEPGPLRYLTTHRYDGGGNRVHTTHPPAWIPIINGTEHQGEFEMQERNETWTYNGYGQVTSHTDVTGRRDTWSYFDANQSSLVFINYRNPGTVREEIAGSAERSSPKPYLDPTDGEGFVKSHVQDADGFAITTNYTRDAEGNPTSISDGEGNTYELEYAPGCKLANVTSPAPFHYQTHIEYDKNGRPTNVTRQVDDNRTTVERTIYDVLGHPLKEVKSAERPEDAPQTEQDVTPTTYYCYDLNENLILERRPESVNLHQYWDLVATVYDERDQVIEVTRGNMTKAFFSQPRSPAAGGCLQDIDDDGNLLAWEGEASSSMSSMGFGLGGGFSSMSSSTSSEGEPTHYENFTGNYQVYAGGVGLRNQKEGNITLHGAFGQTHRAYLYWQVLDTAASSSHATVGFKHALDATATTVTGQLVEWDAFPCWDMSLNAYAYRADVTPLVSDEGPYRINFTIGDDAHDDPWVTAPVGSPLLQGASLVAIQDSLHYGKIQLVENFEALVQSGDRVTTDFYIDSRFTSDSTLWVLGGDGQNQSVGDDGAHGFALGSGEGQNMSWNGAVKNWTWNGGSNQEGDPYSYGNLWDTDVFYVTTQHGWNRLTTTSLQDCIAPQVAILSTPYTPHSTDGGGGGSGGGGDHGGNDGGGNDGGGGGGGGDGDDEKDEDPPSYPPPSPTPSPSPAPMPDPDDEPDDIIEDDDPPPPPPDDDEDGEGEDPPPGGGGDEDGGGDPWQLPPDDGDDGGGPLPPPDDDEEDEDPPPADPPDDDGPVTVEHDGGSSYIFVIPPGAVTPEDEEYEVPNGTAPLPPPEWESTTYKVYDENGNLAAERDGNGYWTQYVYDGYDRQVVRVDAMGGRLEMKYDPVGNMVLERVCGYQTPRSERIPVVAGLLDDRVEEEHCRTDPSEAISRDQILQEIPDEDIAAILGHWTDWLPDPQLPGLLITPFATEEGQIYTLTRHSFDEANREYQSDELLLDSSTGMKLPDGPLTPEDSYASSITIYDPAGKVLRSFNDNGHNTTTEYDSMGRVHRTIDAGKNTRIKHYDAVGNPLNETRIDQFSNGKQSPRVYEATSDHDEMGRRTSSTDASGGTSTTEHNALGRAKASGDPLGWKVHHVYDNSSRTIEDRHEVYEYQYWTTFNWTQIVPPVAESGVFTNNSKMVEDVSTNDLMPGMRIKGDAFPANTFVDTVAGWEFNMTKPATNESTGKQQAFWYYPFYTTFADGNTTLTWENGTQLVFDGALTDVKEGDDRNLTGHIWSLETARYTINITYDYDGDGRLVSQSDGLNQSTNYTYDNLGRKIREEAPDGSWMEFRYDKEDRVTWLRDANGNEVNTSYDPLGRVVQVKRTAAGPDTVGSTEQVFVVDALGRRVAQYDLSEDPADTMYVARSYDSLGRILSETQNWQTSRSTYDGVGNRLSYTYPSGRVLLMSYDVLERLQQVRSTYSTMGWPENTPELVMDQLDQIEVLANYSYLGPSKLHMRELGNGAIVQSNDYDAGGRLKGLAYHDEDDDLLVGFDYTYDIGSRLTGKGKLHGGWSESYLMDGVGRLTNFSRPGGLGDVKEKSWVLDDANNWNQTITTTSGTTNATVNRTHNTENELVTSKETWYTYDDNGNLIEDPEYHYRWDFKNRLREVWSNATPSELVAEYWYDSENRRTKKAVDSVPTVYFLDSWNEVQESDCFGVPLRQYVYGAGVDELIVMDQPIVDVATVPETCAVISGGGTSDLEPALEECLNPIVTTTPPSFDGSCGPCSTLLTTSAQAFVTDTSCNVCVSSAWNYLERDEPSPVSGCMTCDADSTIWFGATAIVVTPEAGCTPCAPNMHGVLVIDYSLTHIWSAEAEAESGCTPCPVQDQNLVTGTNDTSPVPVRPTPNPHPEEHCFGVNLDERLYFLQDEQRSVYGLANKDGELKQGFEYDPYGNVTVFTAVGLTGIVSFSTSDDMGWASDSESPYLYTGRRYDPESGLMQYRTRYYDVEMGRFISRDTIGVWGDPNNLGNAYGYCASAPVGCLDSNGTLGLFVSGFSSDGDSMRDFATDSRIAGNVIGEKRVLKHHEQRTGNRLMREVSKARPDEKIVLVGHSWGGDSIIEMARDMRNENICIDLLVQIDSVGYKDETLPKNVRTGVNIYSAGTEKKWWGWHREGINGATHVEGSENIPLYYTTHNKIDNDERTRNLVGDYTATLSGEKCTYAHG